MFRTRSSLRVLATALMIGALFAPFFSSDRAAAAPNLVNSITFATGQQNGTPQNSGDRFDSGIDNIYAFVDLSGMNPTDIVKLVWYRADRILFTETDATSDLFGGNVPDSGSFWFNAPLSSGFPPGDYRLEVRINDTPQGSGNFRVNAKKGEPVFANTAFADRVSGSGDNLSSPVTPRFDFPSSGGQIFAVFDHYEMDSAKSWGWQLSREGVVIAQKQNQPWNGNAQGTYGLPLNIPGDPGVYDFDLYLNGNWVNAESFVVDQAPVPQARVIKTDDFTDSNSGWGVGKSGSDSANYGQGSYVITAAGGDDFWGVANDNLSSGVIQMQTRFTDVPSNVNETTGWGNYGYLGLVARWQDKNNYYVFLMTPDGQVAIEHELNGKRIWDTKWSLAPNDVLSPGLQPHALRLLENGSLLRFYIDGHLAGVVPNAVWSSGASGAIAGAFSATSLLTADFQQFSEWSLPQNAGSN